MPVQCAIFLHIEYQYSVPYFCILSGSEDVLRLEVSMTNILGVKIFKNRSLLIEVKFGLRLTLVIQVSL